jgi:hypothetical protein
LLAPLTLAPLTLALSVWAAEGFLGVKLVAGTAEDAEVLGADMVNARAAFMTRLALGSGLASTTSRPGTKFAGGDGSRAALEIGGASCAVALFVELARRSFRLGRQADLLQSSNRLPPRSRSRCRAAARTCPGWSRRHRQVLAAARISFDGHGLGG